MPIKPLDLAKNADFALATGSGISTVANLFGRDPSEWDIEEASYNAVVFHVFKSKVDWGGAVPSIRDRGGRRIVRFAFPYRDGGTTDDLGRTAETFDVEAVLYGDNYTSGLRALFAELQKPQPGLLVHPVRGVVECKMLDYELTHSHDQRKAVTLRITFVEHNFTLAEYGKPITTKNFKSLLSDVLRVFTAIQNAVNKVWPLMGYALKEQLYLAERGDTNTFAEEQQAWCSGMKHELMEVLDLTDPLSIVPEVKFLVEHSRSA
jgi:prophage DNA circulation protein